MPSEEAVDPHDDTVHWEAKEEANGSPESGHQPCFVVEQYLLLPLDVQGFEVEEENGALVWKWLGLAQVLRNYGTNFLAIFR